MQNTLARRMSYLSETHNAPLYLIQEIKKKKILHVFGEKTTETIIFFPILWPVTIRNTLKGIEIILLWKNTLKYFKNSSKLAINSEFF